MSDDVFARTLITGASGMFGSYVDFGIKTDHGSLDVTDLSAVRALCEKLKPTLILHLAAATDLARCEREPDYAYRVNSVGTYHMALAAREHGALLVYVSTSSVFDGKKNEPYTPEDAPNPLSVYGHSKYLGELAVQGIVPEYIIARITWVFGGGKERDKKFVSKILEQLDEPVIRAVADKSASPTYAKDAVDAIKRLIEEGKRGVFHVPNSGSATRADIAREIIAITGSKAKVEEVTDADFATPYATGDNEALEPSIPMRPWREALQEYLEEEWH